MESLLFSQNPMLVDNLIFFMKDLSRTYDYVNSKWLYPYMYTLNLDDEI